MFVKKVFYGANFLVFSSGLLKEQVIIKRNAIKEYSGDTFHSIIITILVTVIFRCGVMGSRDYLIP